MDKRISFLAVWIGQVVSMLGSGLTGFALGVWLYQQTGSASNFALVAFCTALPQLMLSPLVGVWVDRYSRPRLMALADSGAALSTLVIAWLFFSGQIQVWHIYLTTLFSAACGTLQGPAYSALVASLIPTGQLGRVNGLLKLGQALAEILAPSLAGVLVLLVGVPGVLLIDLVTYLVAITMLLLARLPAPQAVSTAAAQNVPLLDALKVGWQMLRGDAGLMALMRYQMLFTFLWNIFAVLVVPMVLGFASPDGLGLALTIAGAGLLLGSLTLSAWGGPRNRLVGLLIFELMSALAFCLMGLRPDLVLVAGAAFLAHFTLALVSGLNEALWQERAPAEARGRVFAFKQTAEKGALLLAYLTAGLLADRFIEPLLAPGGLLVPFLGSWLGTGPGRGIAALLVLIGLIKALAVMRLSFSLLSRAAAPAAATAG